ncbi:hypothetical protein [Sphingomonas humi]|uniref:Peptidase S74 domain-containing protein n=1 Tax=Sphingomonas humi TaxID=335630 RepID=A0ABP7S1D9_9SPHN
MPQLFTSKFVDMVRVTTSTQGTGPLVCGPAVPGFASFADSLSVGDNFYYSVQGIDKPQEREVGRGTLLPNGSISRQPLQGSPTYFSNGSKTVALVASSEWYSSVQESCRAGGRLGAVMTRGELKSATTDDAGAARYLAEARREGNFVWDPSVAASLHQADTGEGIFIAPNTGSTGAWVRRFHGPVQVDWFGILPGAGRGASNTTAWKAMVAVLQARAIVVNDYYRSLEPIRFGRGRYEFAETIDLTGGVFVIEGQGVGAAVAQGTSLVFPAGQTGIRVQSFNTAGAAGTRTPGFSAGGSVMRNLGLEGGYAGVEAECHGIHLRGSATVEQVAIGNFQGDGLHVAAAGSGGALEGNANLCRIRSLRVTGNRNGLYFDSADANACLVDALDASANRRWGVFDSSFLGNTYTACHSAANGWDGALGSIPTGCTHNGQRYFVKLGQDAWCSANAPSGTTADNQGWGYVEPGGTYNGIVAWANGVTFRSGGGYCTDDPNSFNAFLGCYAEGDQGPSQVRQPSIVVGGILPMSNRGSAANLSATGGALKIVGGTIETSGNLATTLGGNLNVRGMDNQFGSDVDTNAQGGITFNRFRASSGGSIHEFYTAGIRKLSFGHYGSGALLEVPSAAEKFQILIGSDSYAWDSTGQDLPANKVLRIGGTPIIGPRRTGWTAATGSANRGAFAAAAAGAASASYAQSELQSALNRISALEGRLVALESDCRSHGLIN